MKVMVPKTKIKTQQPDYIKSPIKLTISLLVSNRIGTIRKCMDSLKIILDAVPSELIAVDTVGENNSDGSLDIVREYTDKIVHFDWNGDFAAARNAGLEQARGEWFLYVDDDEWFEDPSELIEFFQNGDYLRYGYTQYAIRSYTNETMTKYSEAWGSRMSRRTPQMRFIHPVHEMLSPMYQPEKKFVKLFAHHVGYIFKSEEERKKHFERNIQPVLAELERDPQNLRLTMQAIQEYMFDEDYETAEEFCRRAQGNNDPQYELVWNWIMAMLVRILAMQKRHQEAIAEGRCILQSPRINELARMNIDYVIVSVAQEIENPEILLEFAQDYNHLGQYFDSHPEKILEQVMLSLGDILKEENRKKIHGCFFMTCKEQKYYRELCEYAGSIAWDKDYMKQRLYFLILLEAVAHTEHYASLAKTVEQVCCHGGFPKDWMGDIQRVCCSSNPDKRYLFRQIFAKAESEEPYFLLLKTWCLEQEGGDVEAALQECLDCGMDCGVPNEELLGICLRTGSDPTPFLEPLYFEDWMLSFSQLVKNTPEDDFGKLLEYTEKTLRPVSEVQYLVLSKIILGTMLDKENFPQDQLWGTVQTYVENTLEYYRNIYQDRLFSDSQHNLPREIVFTMKLKEAWQAREQGDLSETFCALKECVKAYPIRKDFINRLLNQIDNEMQIQNKQQQEFTGLGEQIKKQIYYLISLGQTVQAQQVLEQLRTLTPNDSELDVIAQKI